MSGHRLLRFYVSPTEAGHYSVNGTAQLYFALKALVHPPMWWLTLARAPTQCYTILILSQAVLSLITSYSLGETPYNCHPTSCCGDRASAPWNLVVQGDFPTLGLLVKGMWLRTLMNMVDWKFHFSSKETGFLSSLFLFQSVFCCWFLCLTGIDPLPGITMAAVQHAKRFLLTFCLCNPRV